MAKFYSNITGQSYPSESMRATAEAKYLHAEKLRIESEARKQRELDRKLQRENTERLLNGGLTNQEVLEQEILNAAVERFGEEKVTAAMRVGILALLAGILGFIAFLYYEGSGKGPAFAFLAIGIILLVARWALNIKEKSKVLARILMILGILLLVADFLPLRVVNKVMPFLSPDNVTIYGQNKCEDNGIRVEGELFIQDAERLPVTSVEIKDEWVNLSWNMKKRGKSYNIKFNPHEYCVQNGVYDSNLWKYEYLEGGEFAKCSVYISEIIEDYEGDRLFTSD